MKQVPALDLSSQHRQLRDELETAAMRVLRSGWYVRGPELEGFEAEFAHYCGTYGAVGVGNGLEALQLILVALGVGAGDEVIVPAHTSIATWLAVTHAGAEPVPVEPLADTMQIDPARVREAVTPRTAAIVAVHLYGIPADLDALRVVADSQGLALIEDASQAHGAFLRERRIGSIADSAAFSLYPTKNLGASGDGGIVVSRDVQLLEQVRMLASYGERRRHESELQGYNSRLDELQAALLRVKLRRLDAWNDSRRARAAQYIGALTGCPGVTLPSVTRAATAVWHQFVVRVNGRDEVRAALRRCGVETLVHYPIPPHRSKAYERDRQRALPITEALAESVLSLPMFPHLAEESCAHVACALARIVAERRTAEPANRSA